jgi:IS1 family transposase
MRATARVARVSLNTVSKLLLDAGEACEAFHEEKVRYVTSTKRLQCDEIWAFCYAKKKNAPAEMRAAGTAGDIWTWTGLDPDSKLMVSWFVGDRTAEAATAFMHDLARRVANQVQITTDGFQAYPNAVIAEFRGKAHFAQVQKIYGDDPSKSPERRYSPAICLAVKKTPVHGNPDDAHISTSLVERQNLTMRMSMRRFTRLTNAHRKKVESHCAAIALYFTWYNWVRPHQSLQGKTPAVAADLARNAMTMADIVKLIDVREATAKLGQKSN